MATLNAVILPAKVLKGGRHKVRISVAHNGEIRYINTNIVLDDKSEFKNGSVRKRGDAEYLNTKIRTILNKYSRILDEIESPDCLACSELVLLLKNERRVKNITYREVMEEVVELKKIQPATILLYRVAVDRLVEAIGDIPISRVNHAMILKFTKELRTKRKIKDSSIQQYFHKLNALLNYATRCGYVKLDRNPFEDVDLQQPKPRDCWLSIDEIRTIRDFRSNNERLNYYRDIFMLSYYLGGINAVDLFKIDLSGDYINYIRTKTQSKVDTPVVFKIPIEAKEILQRVLDKNGRLKCNVNYDNVSSCIGWWMKSLRKAAGVPGLIYYSARKSFAQLAYSLDIKESVIDYILGHSVGHPGNRSMARSEMRLYPYVVITPQMATDAIRCVLDKLAEK